MQLSFNKNFLQYIVSVTFWEGVEGQKLINKQLATKFFTDSCVIEFHNFDFFTNVSHQGYMLT